MYGNEGYKLVQCPYDPNHIIRKFRLPYHIVKCKKNYPNLQLEHCVYKFSHLIKKEDFKEHIKMCPNKSRIEKCLYKDETLKHASCQNEYSDASDAETESVEESFYLIEPLEKRSGKEEDRAEYLAMQKKNYCDIPNASSLGGNPHAENHVNSGVSEDDLPPLQLPKTTSKAFQMKKSGSTLSQSGTTRSSISKYFVDSDSVVSGDDNSIFAQIQNYKIKKN